MAQLKVTWVEVWRRRWLRHFRTHPLLRHFYDDSLLVQMIAWFIVNSPGIMWTFSLVLLAYWAWFV